MSRRRSRFPRRRPARSRTCRRRPWRRQSAELVAALVVDRAGHRQGHLSRRRPPGCRSGCWSRNWKQNRGAGTPAAGDQRQGHSHGQHEESGISFFIVSSPFSNHIPWNQAMLSPNCGRPRQGSPQHLGAHGLALPGQFPFVHPGQMPPSWKTTWPLTMVSPHVSGDASAGQQVSGIVEGTGEFQHPGVHHKQVGCPSPAPESPGRCGPESWHR